MTLTNPIEPLSYLKASTAVTGLTSGLSGVLGSIATSVNEPSALRDASTRSLSFITGRPTKTSSFSPGHSANTTVGVTRRYKSSDRRKERRSGDAEPGEGAGNCGMPASGLA